MTDEPEEDSSVTISKWLIGQILEQILPEPAESPTPTEGWTEEPEKEAEPDLEETIEFQHEELNTEENDNDGKSARESPINVYSLSNAAELMVYSVLVSIYDKAHKHF